jgi:hypothetical protein
LPGQVKQLESAMAQVTYYVALPFVAAVDGVAAGEPRNGFNPVAVVMRAEALSRKEGTSAQSPLKRDKLLDKQCIVPLIASNDSALTSGD